MIKCKAIDIAGKTRGKVNADKLIQLINGNIGKAQDDALKLEVSDIKPCMLEAVPDIELLSTVRGCLNGRKAFRRSYKAVKDGDVLGIKKVITA